jgi:hypothetical protein
LFGNFIYFGNPGNRMVEAMDDDMVLSMSFQGTRDWFSLIPAFCLAGSFAVALVVEAAEGAQVLASITGFVAVEQLEGVGFVGQGAEGMGEVGYGSFPVVSLFVHSVGILLAVPGLGVLAFQSFLHVECFLKTPEPHATPVSDGHDVGLDGFDAGLGLKLVFEGIDKGAESGIGFAVENHGVREQAVAGGVLGGASFALGRDGSGGVGGVAGGGAFPFGRDWAA